ncbi:MAG TPA: hypothetical protein VFY12_03390 [Arenimonas sp.]|nr:hypothetical protein [Arenimonas sp.]
MLQKIKSAFREIENGEPGRRFADHHERSRRREGQRGSRWRSVGFISAGVVLIFCGLLLSLPPGIPGFLLWIPGLALIAARWRRFAIWLDCLEAWARKSWQAVRAPHRR